MAAQIFQQVIQQQQLVLIQQQVQVQQVHNGFLFGLFLVIETTKKKTDKHPAKNINIKQKIKSNCKEYIVPYNKS